jgi:hypothetical protein
MLDCYLLQQHWNQDDLRQPHLYFSIDNNSDVDDISDPRLLEAFIASQKKSKYNEDNPSYDMAM